MSDWKHEKMPVKTGKVLSLDKHINNGEHQRDPKGNYKFWVKMEGEDLSYGVSTRDEDGKNWAVGKEVEYEPTKHTSGDGEKTFYTASIPRRDNPPSRATVAPKGAKDYYAEGVITAAKVAPHLLAMKPGAAPEEFTTYFKIALSAIKAELKAVLGE